MTETNFMTVLGAKVLLTTHKLATHRDKKNPTHIVCVCTHDLCRKVEGFDQKIFFLII